MAVKASTEITVRDETDAKALVIWYTSTTSSTTPSKPTTTSASATPSGWSKTEPSISADSDLTKYVYQCVQLVWGDGTCSWGDVSLSASFEAAKKAWNKAQAAQDTATQNYAMIQSRGEQLVTNGAATLGDNTNFSAFTYDGSKANGSGGSFTRTPAASTLVLNEYIPVDQSQVYRISFDALSADGDARLYCCLMCYDIDGNNIDSDKVLFVKNSLTTLAQDLKPGDTQMVLTDVSGFDPNGSDVNGAYSRKVIFWDYQNSFGYTYPEETYSRHLSPYNSWSAHSDIDYGNNTITLRTAWTGSTVPAGTKLSQGNSGATYLYVAASYALVPTDWHTYYGYAGPDGITLPTGVNVRFRAGTAKVRIGFLWNYQMTAAKPQSQIWITNVSMHLAVASQNDIIATNESAVATTESVYYRSTTSATPSISTSTAIGTSATTSNAWEYVMPRPKKGCYFFTCERYTHVDGSVSFSTVRSLDNATYTSKWCASADDAFIDGGAIYANSVTADQIKGGTITANELSVGLNDEIDDAAKTASKYITKIDDSGIKVHAETNASDNYAKVNADGLEVVKGGDSRAMFGETTRIGKEYVQGATDNESHMELDYHSLQMVDKDGDTYFHASDLRLANGVYTATETLQIRNNYPLYDNATVTTGINPVEEIVSVTYELGGTVDDTANWSIRMYSQNNQYATNNLIRAECFSAADLENIEGGCVTVVYTTKSPMAKAFSFGGRADGYAIGGMSFAAGDYNVASGYSSSAFGASSKAQASCAFAEGDYTTALGAASHAEGSGTVSNGIGSHSEGLGTSAIPGVYTMSNWCLPDEVYTNTDIIGAAAHSEGQETQALGHASHAEGEGTVARKAFSHAAGYKTQANGACSTATGNRTVASGQNQVVIGRANVPDTGNDYALIIGNGSVNASSNAAVITWLGEYIAQGWAGVIQMFAGSTPPAGWLLCDGSAVSREDYATLYAAIGDTWGAGDGSTTFNLPDLRGRAPIGAGTGTGLTARTLGGTVGAETHTLNANQIPTHTHALTNVLGLSSGSWAGETYSGSLSGSGAKLAHTTGGGTVGTYTATGAKTGTNGQAHNNMQPSAVVNFIIHTGKTS